MLGVATTRDHAVCWIRSRDRRSRSRAVAGDNLIRRLQGSPTGRRSPSCSPAPSSSPTQAVASRIAWPERGSSRGSEPFRGAPGHGESQFAGANASREAPVKADALWVDSVRDMPSAGRCGRGGGPVLNRMLNRKRRGRIVGFPRQIDDQRSPRSGFQQRPSENLFTRDQKCDSPIPAKSLITWLAALDDFRNWLMCAA
jgi:hypothetical protein